MSHYISTDIEGKEIILTGGSSHRTISAVSYSGFNIYPLFEASLLNGGMSGTCESKIVDFKIAENAYKHAIAWAKAMEQSFPELYKSKFNEIKEYEKDFNTYLINHSLVEIEIEILVKEKRKYHHKMNEDHIIRSFYLLYGIVYFTYHVYKYTKKGNEVKIGFV